MMATYMSWRSIAATWGGAVFLLMRQFGVPSATGSAPETRIVRVAEAGELMTDAERTPDGRILTLPVEPGSVRRRQDHLRVLDQPFAVN